MAPPTRVRGLRKCRWGSGVSRATYVCCSAVAKIGSKVSSAFASMLFVQGPEVRINLSYGISKHLYASSSFPPGALAR